MSMHMLLDLLYISKQIRPNGKGGDHTLKQPDEIAVNNSTVLKVCPTAGFSLKYLIARLKLLNSTRQKFPNVF